MKTKYIACALIMALAMFGTARAQAQNLVVGGKNFTEQLILSNMTAQYLRAKGYGADLKNGLGTTLMRSALESGQLDIVWDYTGTALIVYNHIEEKLEPEQIYEKVKELDVPRGLAWLNESELNNTYAFAMPQKIADEYGINSLQDLADRINADAQDGAKNLRLMGVDYEFASRPDGLGPMQELYGFKLERGAVKQMDPGLVYTALKNEQLFVGLTYASDGRIKGFDLKLLDDDKGYFAAYKATPVVRQEILDRNPQLAEQLNALAASIDTEKMTELNKRVDIDQEPVSKVAADFLKQAGLI
ncbi:MULTISPECIES: glycine betaine ABC transporter substrate-binding protein [unclassified Herbaspirillum]|uniref:glycine betaine ABC transporter substrate-binding protein n=1 Tax=unclassified Herbaspirillum TaxID=2624150 RepID=UPI001151585D|nr:MULTISPECIES: glycine betaine ABC transporter substrate-binding protein [unclassified Herbaspirillum]MBB5392151.1 osmoprotectant transport system substrate-binding protein [Herbaspirillum sp. SJZ102]TQK13608.1 osmoprotectant transport system substrate-binding protein [Herbaspirillum sp. SJZ130]TQK15611.1 osmoprotectant transport system substrate-binding protein [Herbaspirillum sp. SJZ106]TWC71510.1 osmoprotectant transport system substrate-binding protein [Herbaspirillum sp. SJZ099]